MLLYNVLLAWRLRLHLESEGASKDFCLDFLFLLPLLPPYCLLLIALSPSLIQEKVQPNVLLLKVSSVAVCSCW